MPPAYKLAKRLLTIFNGAELKFINSNTGHEISHISLFTGVFNNYFTRELTMSCYLDITNEKYRKNAEQSLMNVKQFFDNLISKK
jgi:hypothetical protein